MQKTEFVGFTEGFEIGLTALGFEVYLLKNYEYIDVGFKNTVTHSYKKLFKNDRTFKIVWRKTK